MHQAHGPRPELEVLGRPRALALTAAAAPPVRRHPEADRGPGRAAGRRRGDVGGYAEADACRRELLLTYFGEPFEPPVAPATTARPGWPPTPGPAPDELRFEVDAKVRHRAWGAGRVLRYDGDRMAVLFDRAGYRTLSIATVLERKLLRAR